MAKRQIHWVGIFDGVENKIDLKLKPGEYISLPPSDGRCDCCGAHIRELKPFGEPGHWLYDPLTRGSLLKNYRSVGPYDEKAGKAVEEACQHFEAAGFDHPLDWMIEKYGKEKAEELYWLHEAYGQGRDSWECRDCDYLNDEEYFEKLKHRNS